MHSPVRFQHPGASPGQFQTTYNEHFGHENFPAVTPSISADYEPPGILLRGEFLTTYQDHFRPVSEPTTSDRSFEEVVACLYNVQFSDARAPRQLETTYSDHYRPSPPHSSTHMSQSFLGRDEFLTSSQLWLNPRTLPRMPVFPPGRVQRPKSMTALIRESSSHQRSLRKHTPIRSKVYKSQSLTQPRDTEKGREDPKSTTSRSTFPTQESQTMDSPEPGMARVLQEVKQQEVIPQDVIQQEVILQDVVQQEVIPQDVIQQEVIPQDVIQQEVMPQDVIQQEVGQQEVKQQEVKQQEVKQQKVKQQKVKQQEVKQQEVKQQKVKQQKVKQQEVKQQKAKQQEVVSVFVDQPYSEEARESHRAKQAVRPSSMLSLTINNRAMQLHCGLVKKCWSEMQMGSVNLPLYLTQMTPETNQAPALTLPRPLLSALVPAPSPLPVSLLQRRTPTSKDGLDASMPWEDPSLIRDPRTKRCLPGLCLFLSFFFQSFRSYPIYLPSSSRRIPG